MIVIQGDTPYISSVNVLVGSELRDLRVVSNRNRSNVFLRISELASFLERDGIEKHLKIGGICEKRQLR